MGRCNAYKAAAISINTTPQGSIFPALALVSKKADIAAMTILTPVNFEGVCLSSWSQNATKNG